MLSVIAKVLGSRQYSMFVPLSMISDVPSVVSAHPSPLYVNSPVCLKVFQS